MIQLKTLVNCIDNSGAAIVECVKVMRMKRHARIGDRIIVVVQKQRNFGPESAGGGGAVSISNKVRRGDIRHAVVVRTAKKYQRADGSVVKFDDNACVLVNKGEIRLGRGLMVSGVHRWGLFVWGIRGFWSKTSGEEDEGGWEAGDGVVGSELRDKKWSKILSLAPMHV
ncbi:54S ribosomal protein L38, mitochondrial [Coniosporium tulheliwenetii]|uniref:54S ribosomal protein L38, mitochondrial n=1 Tax=Coniosporium tulheliwenetii TaxID=3383036 RepID=A0ACC2YWD6_9PEZI|nr:54S ribosomal protein L38, mitochondrial [Cladosporium sp. JES 115]